MAELKNREKWQCVTCIENTKVKVMTDLPLTGPAHPAVVLFDVEAADVYGLRD